MNRLIPVFGLVLLAACGAPRYARIVFEPPDTRMIEAQEEETSVEKVLNQDKLTIENMLYLATMLNPDLAAAGLDVDIRAAEAWDAGLFPNPSFVFEVEEAPTSGSVGDAKRVGGFEFQVPVTGRLGAARGVKEIEREVAIERFRETRRRILVGVKIAFYELLAAAKRRDLLLENLRIAGALHGLVEEKFKNAAAPETDLLKAAIELSVVGMEARNAERQVGTAQKALRALVGGIDLPFERLAGELREEFEAVSEEALEGEILSTHPGLQAARQEARAADLGVELARAERWSDLGVGLRGGTGAEGDSIVEFGVSIPLPLFNTNRAKIQAAELQAEQARHRVESVRQTLLNSLRRAHVNYLSAQERVRTYKTEILPKAEKSLKLSDEGYRAGGFSFLAVLDSQRTLSETRMAFQIALLDLERAAAAIEELVGRRLRAVR